MRTDTAYYGLIAYYGTAVFCRFLTTGLKVPVKNL